VFTPVQQKKKKKKKKKQTWVYKLGFALNLGHSNNSRRGRQSCCLCSLAIAT